MNCSDDTYCLGIESTADDFGVGILSFKGRALANINSAYINPEGGIHPREASRHHAGIAGEVLSKAFHKAEIKPKEIAVVAFSQGPGLGPCLRTGATAARALSSYLNVPLVGVNHCVAHIEIGKLVSKAKDPVTLYVSGGNTIISAFDGGKYRVFGETLDIAVGNCLDVFARAAGLRQKEGMPFGAMVENVASRGHSFVSLPYSVKGMNLSFSGLLTAAVQLLKSGKHTVEDLCFSLQEVGFSMLAEVTERALAHTEKPEVLLTGGVAANNRLQSMVKSVADEHKVRFCVVPKEYALDNGAMIAWTGILAYQHNMVIPTEKSFVRLKWRLDDVHVPWVES
ncbi:MAG: KEOPS complex N(6)-L-threonylcarbamoyladenine synthase Kae1 [Candidatus Bathyarchaeota archaeon]|nr:KEOPS complex N(6)-L-threonylcarbamoyladenine synthase Kae1 [Candidatus Bathyarchaeota archaeon]MDH5732318.1 KEOPS complex N(6)-L-threonylcarbamoyladenine synthase Kae1 [Candidatus Bathyarchaeota archaeon]